MSVFKRQIAVMGRAFQFALHEQTVTIVGLGALGSCCAEILVRSGIRRLVLIDDDMVELSNLSRQSLYIRSDISKLKVESAKKHLNKICETDIKIIPKKVTPQMLTGITLDCTDNLKTKNELSRHTKNLITGSVYASVGYLFVSGEKRFHQIFKEKKEKESDAVLPTVVRIVASMMVTECFKKLANQKNETHLIRVDTWNHEIIKLKP